MTFRLPCIGPIAPATDVAAGPTMEVLKSIRDRHRTRFTNRINVDIHSGGGWSPEFWSQAEVRHTHPHDAG